MKENKSKGSLLLDGATIQPYIKDGWELREYERNFFLIKQIDKKAFALKRIWEGNKVDDFGMLTLHPDGDMLYIAPEAQEINKILPEYSGLSRAIITEAQYTFLHLIAFEIKRILNKSLITP